MTTTISVRGSRVHSRAGMGTVSGSATDAVSGATDVPSASSARTGMTASIGRPPRVLRLVERPFETHGQRDARLAAPLPSVRADGQPEVDPRVVLVPQRLVDEAGEVADEPVLLVAAVLLVPRVEFAEHLVEPPALDQRSLKVVQLEVVQRHVVVEIRALVVLAGVGLDRLVQRVVGQRLGDAQGLELVRRGDRQLELAVAGLEVARQMEQMSALGVVEEAVPAGLRELRLVDGRDGGGRVASVGEFERLAERAHVRRAPNQRTREHERDRDRGPRGDTSHRPS